MSNAYQVVGPFSPPIAEPQNTARGNPAGQAVIAAGEDYDRRLLAKYWDAIRDGQRSVFFRPVGAEEAAALLQRTAATPPPGVAMPPTFFAMGIFPDFHDGSACRELVQVDQQRWEHLSRLACFGRTLCEKDADELSEADICSFYRDDLRVGLPAAVRKAA